MIIVLGDKAFVDGAPPAVCTAIEAALGAHRLGHHALVVSPQGLHQAENSTLAPHLKKQLELAHSGWLEAQGLVRRARRVIELTGSLGEHGTLHGNRFYAHVDFVAAFGVPREPSYVVEALNADGKYLRLLLQTVLDFDEAELRRFWGARPEAGGGGATHQYVNRYEHDASPTVILCDRDGPDLTNCGATAVRCADALAVAGYFPSRAAALVGGYSAVVPNLAFRVLGAFEMENFILPRLAQILFDEIVGAVGEQRKALVLSTFPNFPSLTPEEADRWLSVDFKTGLGCAPVFTRTCLTSLTTWVAAHRDNFERARTAIRDDLQNASFMVPVSDAVLDVWSIGARNQRLS